MGSRNTCCICHRQPGISLLDIEKKMREHAQSFNEESINKKQNKNDVRIMEKMSKRIGNRE